MEAIAGHHSTSFIGRENLLFKGLLGDFVSGPIGRVIYIRLVWRRQVGKVMEAGVQNTWSSGVNYLGKWIQMMKCQKRVAMGLKIRIGDISAKKKPRQIPVASVLELHLNIPRSCPARICALTRFLNVTAHHRLEFHQSPAAQLLK